MTLDAAFTVMGLFASYANSFAWASTSRDKTCMSEIRPAHAAPTVSAILNTFFTVLLMIMEPYVTLFSAARIAPSAKTRPIVVAPGR